MALRTKIAILASLLLIVAIAASSYMVILLHEKSSQQNLINRAKDLSDIVINHLQENREGDHTEAFATDAIISFRTSDLQGIRLLTPEGIINYSLKASEISQPSQEMKHSRVSPQRPVSVFQAGTMAYFQPLQNKASCQVCHALSADLLGYLEIRYDLAGAERDNTVFARTVILLNIVIGILMGILMSLIFYRMFIRPVNSLNNTIQAVESGDLNARVSFDGSDEFSSLARNFNTMLDEVQQIHTKHIRKEKEVSRVKMKLEHKSVLEQLNAQLQNKVTEVESANQAVVSLSREVKSKNVELEKMITRLKKINEIGRLLSSIINIDELLKIIVKTSAETLRVEKSSVYLTKNKNSSKTIYFQNGVGFHEGSSERPIQLNPLYQQMLVDGRQVFFNEGAGTDPKGPASAIGVPLRMKGQIVGGVLLENRLEGGQFSHDDIELLDTMANQSIVALENAWLYETVKSNYFGTIQSLVNALEASDRYTKGHSERVKFLSLKLARFMGFDMRELEVLEHAAILHDIGKIGIDTSVLNKQDELTHSEFSLIRAHPIIGDEILGPIGTLQGVRTTILQHHERYDGKGYPYGIAGEEITLKARILAVIDTFDAMLTDRPYRKALHFEKALEEIRKGKSTQFDPTVVNAFLEIMKDNENLLQEAGYKLW